MKVNRYMIIMDDVHKTYSTGVTALNGVNVEIDNGEFVYIVGPSGAGKSTFIRLIYREEVPNKGEISINGMITNEDRKSTRLNSSHVAISYAVFCLKKKNKTEKKS